MEAAIVIFVVVQAIGSAFFAARIAGTKGRDTALWFIAGLCCGLAGLIAAGFMPTKEQEEIDREARRVKLQAEADERSVRREAERAEREARRKGG